MGYGLMGGLGDALTRIATGVIPNYQEAHDTEERRRLLEEQQQRQAQHQALMEALAQKQDVREQAQLDETLRRNKVEEGNWDRTFGLNEKKFGLDEKQFGLNEMDTLGKYLQPGMNISPESQGALGALGKIMVGSDGKVVPNVEHDLRMKVLQSQIDENRAQAARAGRLGAQESDYNKMRALDLRNRMTSGFPEFNDLLMKEAAQKDMLGNPTDMGPLKKSALLSEYNNHLNGIDMLVAGGQMTAQDAAAAKIRLQQQYEALLATISTATQNAVAGGGAAGDLKLPPGF